MSDICVFRNERNGRFINCSVLKNESCHAKCSFRKSENEFKQGQINAENRLRKMGLQAVIAERADGERYVTTEKALQVRKEL